MRRLFAVVSITAIALALFAGGWSIADDAPAAGGGSVCDVRGARGAYSMHGNGTVLGGPFALAGQIRLDGKGNVSGALTEIFDGHVDRTTILEGTYSLSSSCKGVLEIVVQHHHDPVTGEPAERVDHHSFDFYLAAQGRRAFWALTDTWAQEPGDIPEGVATISGQLERR